MKLNSLQKVTLLIDRRQRRRNKRLHSPAQRTKRISLGLIAFFVLLSSLIILIGVWSYADLTRDLPSLEILPALLEPPNGILLEPTRIYDRSGAHLLQSLENPGIARKYLPIDEADPAHISPELIKATLAVDDPTFWTNPGYSTADLLGEGHATLAQRLVYEMLLSNEPPGLRRNLRERLLAAQVISEYGRQKVLEWYINSANYGHMAYGAEAGAQLYFNKSASSLTLAEAAVLVAVSNAPALNPIDAPQAIQEIQQKVLEDMVSENAIGLDAFVDAVSSPLNFRSPGEITPNPYQVFINLALEQAYGYLGKTRVERGGLQIYTTLDYDLQNQTICTLKTQLARLGGNQKEIQAGNAPCLAARLLPTLSLGNEPYTSELIANATIVDVEKGEILALAGDLSAGQDASYLSDHPASSLAAPLIYLTGFARGLNPSSLIWDIPANIPESMAGVKNLDGKFHGPERLRVALVNDDLVPAAQLLNQLGQQSVRSTAENFGIDLSGDANLEGLHQYFLGEVPATVIDVARWYSIFANQGIAAGHPAAATGAANHNAGLQLSAITQISDKDDRSLIDWTQPEAQAVISQPLAYLMNHILSDETARWRNLGHPNALEIGRPAGAKLGQTADQKESWTAGYTPQRLVVTWLGSPDVAADRPTLDVKYSAGIWNALIKYATKDLPPEGWKAPAGVSTLKVCDPSGLLPTNICPTAVSEVFLTGNEPTSADTLFRTFLINRETGRLATVFTSPEVVENRVYLVIPPEARDWANSVGYPIQPEAYDVVQIPAPLPDTHFTKPAMFANIRGAISIEGTAAGEDFSFYRVQVGKGLNPKEWIQLGKDTMTPISEGKLGEWDTKDENGLYAVRLMVVMQDQRVETATIQVTVDNQPPEVEIPYPAQGETVKAVENLPLTLQAMAHDNMSVGKVEGYVDGMSIGATTQPPYVFLWDWKTGEHKYYVRVYDSAGNMTDSEPITFTVETD